MARLRVGNPDRICIHHSAVSPAAAGLVELKNRCNSYEIAHSKKTWAETIKTGGEYGYYYIEYHAAIAKNGFEMTLQDDKYVLYHAGDNAKGDESFNLHGVALLIDGNYETETYTPEQLEGTARYIARFEKKYKVDVIVRGHKETSISATACPGKNLGTSQSGFIKLAIDRANIIIKENLPTNPLQEDVVINPCEEYKEEITRLEAEVERLQGIIDDVNEALGNSQKALQVSGERVEFLEGTLAIREEELRKSEEQVVVITGERDRIESEKLVLQQELSELKQGRDTWISRIADVLHKLFGMGK